MTLDVLDRALELAADPVAVIRGLLLSGQARALDIGADRLRRALRWVEVTAEDARAYDAAAKGRRTDGWLASGTSANAEVELALATTRDRARDLVRNTAIGQSAKEHFVSNLIGSTGIWPEPQTGDAGRDREIRELFDDWAMTMVPDHGMNWLGYQWLGAGALVESGEFVSRLRPRRTDDGMLVPLQVQPLESDMLDHNKNERLPNGGRIIQGVEFDPIGRRSRYWLLPEHPGDSDGWGASVGLISEAIPIPADLVTHLYIQDRPGQVRGITWLHAIMQAVWDLHGAGDAERMRQKLSSCNVAFVASSDSDGPIAMTVNDKKRATTVTDAKGRLIEKFAPGMIAYLPDGKTVSFHTPTMVGGFDTYKRIEWHEIAAGTGMPYELLTGDLSQVNFSSIRMGSLEFRRLMAAYRAMAICPLSLDPIWTNWVFAGRVSASADVRRLLSKPIRKRWSEPEFEEVDRVTAGKADQLDIRIGKKTLTEVLAAKGKPLLQYIDERRKELELLKEAGIVLDSNPAETAMAGTTQSDGPRDPAPADKNTSSN